MTEASGKRGVGQDLGLHEGFDAPWQMGEAVGPWLLASL